MAQEGWLATVQQLYGDSFTHNVVVRERALWEGVVFHPFLTGCKAGARAPTTAAQFDRWLAQDYHFVVAFTEFARLVHARAPPAHRGVLADGIEVLLVELEWFLAKAEERGVNARATPISPACAAYNAKMLEMHGRPYCVVAAFFWATEFSYNEGWLRNAPLRPELRDFEEHWSNAGFTAYVRGLGRHADEACQAASPEERRQVEEIIVWAGHAEKAFWDDAMTAA